MAADVGRFVVRNEPGDPGRTIISVDAKGIAAILQVVEGAKRTGWATISTPGHGETFRVEKLTKREMDKLIKEGRGG